MALPRSRPGEPVCFNGRVVEFSFWPSRDTPGGRVPQTRLFALDPWAIIRQAVERDCPLDRRPEALACLAQARDFFQIGTHEGVEAARPLALYYSYLNTVKAFILTRGSLATLDGAHHGLVPQRRRDTFDLSDAFLQASPSEFTATGTPKPHLFDEMSSVLTGERIRTGTNYDLTELLPQILSGHRLWVEGAGQPERFFFIQRVEFRRDPATRAIWVQIELLADDLARFGIASSEMLAQSGLAGFEEVEAEEPGYIRLQEKSPFICPDDEPLVHLDHLVQRVRHQLWMTVALVQPYRRYYLYLSPPAERASRMAQLLCMYAVTFYFGSITRYRPHQFDALLGGGFGPRIRDFITGQPRQFLYQMASEMARRDVARPSIL
jgi:hypothetical protein